MELEDFLELAKKELSKILKRDYNMDVPVEHMYIVSHSSHVLDYNECILVAKEIPDKYAEVTLKYNRKEMYIVMYESISRHIIKI